MSSNAFILEESLFRDHSTFEKVLAYFKSPREDLVPVFANQEVVGALLSPEAAKDVLSERILRRLSERPDLLKELTDRVENDEIVD